MEPKIEKEKRRFANEQQTYFCSLCGKQLLVLNKFIPFKPFYAAIELIADLFVNII
jgi:hypothetical protein